MRVREILLTLALCLLLALAFVSGHTIGRKSSISGAKVQYDTTIHYVPITSRMAPVVSQRALPSIPTFIYYVDTLTQEVDSLGIALEFVQRVQRDSAGLYTAYVSGPMVGNYGPKMDSIEFSIPERVITKTETFVQEKKMRPRYSLGVSVGYGIPFYIADEVRPCPYIGISVNYNLLNFGYR